MSAFAISTYSRKGKGGRLLNILSVFVHPVPFSEEELDEAIVPWLSSGGPYDRIFVAGLPASVQHARVILTQESAIRVRLQKTLRLPEQHVLTITWAEDQTGFQVQTLAGSAPEDFHVAALDQRFTLYEVFVRSGGLITATKGTHFTKPSGTHSWQFVRAANVLEKSSAGHQLVFWLYPVLRDRTLNRIIVDTSGIASIAFSLAYERLRWGAAEALPMIESHASYGGLDTLSVPDPDHTLFIISASTSGSLAQKLIDKGALPNNIVTLFFLGKSTPGHIICDLNSDESNKFAGIASIANFTADTCPACHEHSYPIPIVGDQFRTEPAKVEEIEVLLSDFDEASRATLDRLVSTNLFRAFRTVGQRKFELYLDVESMFSTIIDDPATQGRVNEIRNKLSRLMRRGTTVNLRHIVPTSYPGTDVMAASVVAALPSGLREHVRVIKSSELAIQPTEREKATLVVSGCMDDTYELMGISRDLRAVQPGGSITYVSPLFRTSSEPERRRIESNLTFGDQGPKSFTLLSVVAVDFPACAPDHSWQREYERLQELHYWCELTGREVPTAITQRIELLRAAPGLGLCDNLFWNAPNGATLGLAADFTMIPTNDGQRKTTQADVFAIGTTLFHKYRQGVGKKARLVYKTYERTVISPESFQRFSDGVLQAAFLRAARQGEIAYGNCDEVVSERMMAFLSDEVAKADQGGGPALMEYLISLLIKRLTLYPKHTRIILTQVVEKNLGEHFTIIAEYLLSEMEGCATSEVQMS